MPDFDVAGYLDGQQVCGQQVQGTDAQPALAPGQSMTFDLSSIQVDASRGQFGPGEHTARVEVYAPPLPGYYPETTLDDNGCEMVFTARDTTAPVIVSAGPDGVTVGRGLVTLEAVTGEACTVRYGTDPNRTFDQMRYETDPAWQAGEAGM